MDKSKNKRKQTGRGTHPNSLANLYNGKQGRPKGSKNHNGLQSVLDMLKALVSEEENLKKLKKAMQKSLNSNPLYFFSKYIMPLLPKNIDVTSDNEQIIIQVTGKYAPQPTKDKSK